MILQNNTPTKSKKNISNKTKTNTMDKTTKNQMDRKKCFIQRIKKLPNLFKQQKKLKLHHDNFRQGMKYRYL